MTSEWQGESYFRIYGRELVSKPATSLNNIEADTVEQLMFKLAVTTDGFCLHPRLLGDQKIMLAKILFLPFDNVEIMFQRQSVVNSPRTKGNTISGHVRWKSAAQDSAKNQKCRPGLGFSFMTRTFRTKFNVIALGSSPHKLLQQ